MSDEQISQAPDANLADTQSEPASETVGTDVGPEPNATEELIVSIATPERSATDAEPPVAETEAATALAVSSGEPAPPVAPPPVPAAPSAPVTLTSWRYSRDAWRITRNLHRRYVDLMFRTRSATAIPPAAHARLLEMGLAPEAIADTLPAIHSVSGWSAEWIETAQRYLGEFRRQISKGSLFEAGQARQTAALCYHAAQMIELDDMRTVRQCRAAAATLFTMSLPTMHPNVRRMDIPWRNRVLPAYFRMPPDPIDEPVGVIVLLNGIGLSKEETLAWTRRFSDGRYAVLCLDTPGSGEATAMGLPSPDHDDILDGVYEVFRKERLIDLNRVVVAGVSLGANLAVHVAAHDRRVMACVAVTPPYHPVRWMRRMSPILRDIITLQLEDTPDVDIDAAAHALSLEDVAPRLTQPLLVMGSARDVIVPPNESQLLASRVGEGATFVWYPALGHCLYQAPDQWTFEAMTWIDAVARRRADGKASPAEYARAGETAINASTYEPLRRRPTREDDDDFEEYARVLPVSKDDTDA